MIENLKSWFTTNKKQVCTQMKDFFQSLSIILAALMLKKYIQNNKYKSR